MKIQRAYFPKGIEFARNELAEQAVAFTRGTGADGGVVGLSGGIDSTTIAYLCKFAFDRYNAENPGEKPLNLYGAILPSKANNSKDAEDGLRVANTLGIEAKVVEIEPIAEKFLEQMKEIKNTFDRGNLYSETRAVVLSRLAATKNCRVMGTGNWDEDYVLGYFTKRGDGAVDNNLIGNLPKRLVREMAGYLGVPKDLVQRVPTAGLWQGQTDEGELGYTYEQAEIIQNGYDLGMTPEQIAQDTGFNIQIVKNVSQRHNFSEHKRNVPPTGRLTLAMEDVK